MDEEQGWGGCGGGEVWVLKPNFLADPNYYTSDLIKIAVTFILIALLVITACNCVDKNNHIQILKHIQQTYSAS